MSTSRIQQKITPNFRIVDETPEFLVVDKPPFVQVHPSKPGDNGTLWHKLRDVLAFELLNGGQVSIINRLDRETSGLTLVAKTRTAARALCRQMTERTIGKGYLAIAWGWPAQDSWTVDQPILRQGSVRNSPIHLKQAVHSDGAPARTHFKVRERLSLPTSNGDRFSIINAEPETGRMHQIRVHLSHSGHPIVGDKIYGPDEQCYLEFIRTGWTPSLESRLLLNRHALHSAALRLAESGVGWQSDLPADLRSFLHSSKVH